ncbi:MAG: helix-turn-helix domain-containing protein [Actinomycetota bacterium]
MRPSSKGSFALDSSTLSIGTALRDARCAADTSIEEAAWRTRIRPEYLRALENDCFGELGEAVFVRGHLHSYARSLNLDTGDILEAYDREFDGGNPIEMLDRRERSAKRQRPPRPRWLLAAAFAASVLIGVSAVGLVHGPGQKRAGELSLPDLPRRLEALAPASRNNPIGTTAAAKPLTLVVAVTGRCWVEIVADGKVVLSEVLDEGGTRTISASKALKVTLGNAGIAKLTFNGAAVALDATGVWSGSFGPSGLIS